jgi:hypothetical protein
MSSNDGKAISPLLSFDQTHEEETSGSTNLINTRPIFFLSAFHNPLQMIHPKITHANTAYAASLSTIKNSKLLDSESRRSWSTSLLSLKDGLPRFATHLRATKRSVNKIEVYIAI